MKGFQHMDRDRHRAAASKGGKEAQRRGRAHKFTTAEAKAAGSKGGRTHTAEHMREIGRRGGLAKGKSRKVNRVPGAAPVPRVTE